MNNKFSVFTLALFLGAISGCSNNAPECSDSETKQLVLEIAKDEIKKQAGERVANAVSLSLAGVRTTDFNEKTGSQQCAAELKMSGKNGTKSIDVTYTSELVDDTDEFYVTVYGL